MNEKIEMLLSTYAGDDTDLCYYILDILNQSENPGSSLEYFMEKVRTRSSDETYSLEKKFSINELQQLDSIYSKYVDELFINKEKKLFKPECYKGNLEALEIYYQE